MFKKYAKKLVVIGLCFITIFNLIALAKVYFSVRSLKNQSELTQELTQELAFLKEDILLEDESSEELSSQTLAQTLQSELQTYYDQEQLNQAKQYLSDFFKTDIQVPETFIKKQNNTSVTVYNQNSQELLSVKYDDVSQTIYLNSISTYDEYSLYQFDFFKEQLAEQLTQQNLEDLNSLNQSYEDFITQVNQLNQNQDSEVLSQKELKIDTPFFLNSKAFLNTNKQNETMLVIQKDLSTKEYSLLDKRQNQIVKSPSWDEIQASYFSYIKENTFQTILEENIQAKITFIKDQLNQDEFLAALQTYKLSISEFTEDNTQFKVSINAQEKEILSLRINKQDGQVYLKVGDSERVIDFQDLNFQTNQEDQTSTNYLILGKHGSLTDTIIVANVNNQTQQIKMVSLPRDLYIENRKINSLYTYYGMNYLVKKIENLTGLKIERYALVDMYAFIDLVDYLGGIDVNLDRPLVDPSYRTFDDNQWGTLNLSAGLHHVNGRQALRIARSRHSTSDFDRAHRQHLIIEGLKDRVSELGAKDIKTITQVALLGIDSTETDVSFSESLKLYKKYKDYDIADSLVLSSGNILESTYTGSLNSDDPNVLQNAETRGAYILLPKNNDWSIIRTFVQGFLRN